MDGGWKHIQMGLDNPHLYVRSGTCWILAGLIFLRTRRYSYSKSVDCMKIRLIHSSIFGLASPIDSKSCL